MTRPYVDHDDPLGLKQFYESGKLNEDGLVKARFLLITNGKTLFENEKDYDRMSKQFVKWVDEMTRN
jgi:hypothetical protein